MSRADANGCALLIRFRGRAIVDINLFSTIQGSSTAAQATRACRVIHVSKTISPGLVKVWRLPLPTRRSLMFRVSDSRQPSVSRSVEPSALPLKWSRMPSDNLTFVVTKNGSPLTKESFGNWFHDCCIEAGLTAEVCDASGRAKGLASHGLRKRMAERLAHLGCGDEWIAAVLGHKDTRQVKVYTKGANRRRMARSALATLIEAEQPRTHTLQN